MIERNGQRAATSGRLIGAAHWRERLRCVQMLPQIIILWGQCQEQFGSKSKPNFKKDCQRAIRCVIAATITRLAWFSRASEKRKAKQPSSRAEKKRLERMIEAEQLSIRN